MSDDGYKALTPHWSEFEEVSAEIRKVIADFISNPRDDAVDYLDENIAMIIQRTVVQELQQFHAKAERIEADLQRWYNKPPPPPPPYKELLKRYIRHVADAKPLLMTMRKSSENFTTEEKGILLALEVEAMGDEQKRR